MPNYMSQIPPEPKPKKASKMKSKRDSMEARDPKRALPAKDAAKGTMGSTYDQAQARQQRLLADMRKRMMLRKDKKNK
jgi:hypothetical protein